MQLAKVYCYSGPWPCEELVLYQRLFSNELNKCRIFQYTALVQLTFMATTDSLWPAICMPRYQCALRVLLLSVPFSERLELLFGAP